MKYYEMIEVSETMEFEQIVNGKTCKMTEQQTQDLEKTVSEIWGETKVVVSPKGVVFSNDKGEDVYCLGRINRDFNFIKKSH